MTGAGNTIGLVVMYTYFVVLGVLCLYGFHRYLMVYLYYRHAKRDPKIDKTFDPLPPVTVQLPIYNEMYVAERLIDASCQMEYPAGKLQIQVLDDSTDETVDVARNKVAEWKARGVDIEYIHRSDRIGYKAGALDHGLKTATGEFIALFDADFVPQPDFLQKTVHYFTDEKVG